MSLAEFQAGFWRGVLTRVETIVTLADVPSALVTRVNTALATFYGNNTSTIEGAVGVPGVAARGFPVASQAGLELAMIVQRQKTTASAADWGAQLANRLGSTGRARDRIRIRRDGAGAVIAEEISG